MNEEKNLPGTQFSFSYESVADPAVVLKRGQIALLFLALKLPQL